MGIIATVKGEEIIVGNEMLFAELALPLDEAALRVATELRSDGKSAVVVASRQGTLGVIAIADTVRPQAAAMIEDLKKLGIRRIVMLTGDNTQAAEAIAAQVGITDVRAGLLPHEKLETIEGLMREGEVAMVGDGVNDAPALATATLGIAMGAAGTDVALETADVVLMADDLSKLPYAIALSRRTRRTIRQNLTFSLAVIAVLVTSALTIGIPLPLGVVGHEGSTIIVVMNGLRLLRTPR
jgi:Cd2+/Zn2+-exporting ATPase